MAAHHEAFDNTEIEDGFYSAMTNTEVAETHLSTIAQGVKLPEASLNKSASLTGNIKAYHDSFNDTQLDGDISAIFPAGSYSGPSQWFAQNTAGYNNLQNDQNSVLPPANPAEDSCLKNPFTDNPTLIKWHLRQVVVSKGVVNGYIKMRVGPGFFEPVDHTEKRRAISFGNAPFGVHQKRTPRAVHEDEKVHHIPPHFGRGYRLDRGDQVLLAFC